MLMDKTRIEYGNKKNKVNISEKDKKEIEDFNRMLGERYLSEEEKAEKIRKEKELKNRNQVIFNEFKEILIRNSKISSQNVEK